MTRTVIISWLVVLFQLLVSTKAVYAVQVQLDATGTLLQMNIEGVDLPYGFGSPAPTSFTASFLYETDISLATSIDNSDPSDVGYGFLGPPYFGSVAIGLSSYQYNDMTVGVTDNVFVDSSEIFGLIPSGTYDGFGLSGTSPGAIFDNEDSLTTGIEFFLVFLTNTSFLSGTDTIPTAPPALAESETLFFFGDATDDIVNRLAFGRIDSFSTTVVPIPAGIWLLLSGLIALAGFGSHRKRS